MREECLVVEIRVEGDGCPLATATNGARVEAEPPLRRADGNALLRFTTADPQVGERLDENDDIRYLHASRADGRWNYRCLSKHRCVLHDLIDVGFLPEASTFEDGSERHLGAVVGRDVLQQVLEAAGEAVGVGIERIIPLGEEGDTAISRQWDLTPTQEAAIRTGYTLGYFEVPRAADASDVAAELGISKSAFLERLRRGQATLFRQLL